MSRLDRLIGWLSPERAAKRAVARARAQAMPELLGRFYEAARPSRQSYGWLAGFTSANAEVWGSLAVLRARSRELVRNNPHARKAIAALVNNSVGTGILPRANTGNADLNKLVNALWQEWAGSTACDAEGQLNVYGLQKLAVRSFFEGGESLVRKYPQGSASGLPVPLQLQVLEGDYIDHNKNMMLDDGGRIVQGVELNPKGARRAYWLFQGHPGEMPVSIRPDTFLAAPVPATSVLHLYEKERPGQVRGVAWLYAVMVKLRELETYEEAELIRKRLEACLAAVVVNPEAIADPASGDAMVTQGVTDLAGNKVEAMEPGMFYYARGGSDVRFNSPAAAPGYADYKSSQLHSCAAGALVTYELLTGDLTGVNYSSIRAGMLEFRRLMCELQWLTIIPMVCDPIWRTFIDMSVLAGKLPSNTPYGVKHTPPKFEAVDPLKDNTADVIAARAGLEPMTELIAERGYDADELIEEQADFFQKAADAGLVLDSNPAQVAKTGGAQPNVKPSVSPDGGSDPSERELRELLTQTLKPRLNGSTERTVNLIVDELKRDGAL